MSPNLTAVIELLTCTMGGMQDAPVNEGNRTEVIGLMTKAQTDLASIKEANPSQQSPLAMAKLFLDCTIDHAASTQNFSGDAGELQKVIDNLNKVEEAE